MTTAPSLPDLYPELRQLLNRTDVTVAELVNLPEDLRYELINGRLVLSPTATTLHSVICRQIANAVDVGCPPTYAVGVEQAVFMAMRTERRPDVVVIEGGAAFRSPIHHADVLLAVEVVSPGSVVRDYQEKVEEYARIGIPSYWLVDPHDKRVSFAQFLLGEGNVYHRHLHTDKLVTVDLPWEVTLDLPAWTRRRDAYRRLADS